MVRNWQSVTNEAALDLRERRDDLLDSGTGELEDGDKLLTSCPPPRATFTVFPLRSACSNSGPLSSWQSDSDGALGTWRGACV